LIVDEALGNGQNGGTMMKRILVPIDFSTRSLDALRQALTYTHTVRGELLLLHVIEGDPLRWYAVDGLPEAPSSRVDPTGALFLPQVAQKLVHRDLYEEAQWKLAALLPPRPDRFRTLVTVGKPTEEIVRVAREQQTDLIIMATQGRRGWQRLLRRSVTDQVRRRAPVPVLTVDGNQICLSRTPAHSTRKAVEREVPETVAAMIPAMTVHAGAKASQEGSPTPRRRQRAGRGRCRASSHVERAGGSRSVR
jgi:nucleotide-binding universal stress UspA family protein